MEALWKKRQSDFESSNRFYNPNINPGLNLHAWFDLYYELLLNILDNQETFYKVEECEYLFTKGSFSEPREPPEFIEKIKKKKNKIFGNLISSIDDVLSFFSLTPEYNGILWCVKVRKRIDNELCYIIKSIQSPYRDVVKKKYNEWTFTKSKYCTVLGCENKTTSSKICMFHSKKRDESRKLLLKYSPLYEVLVDMVNDFIY